MIGFVFICLVIGLVFVQCLADSAQQLIVGQNFLVHDVQGWSPRALVVDSQGYLWFVNNFAGDSVLQLNHEGKHVSSLRTIPASKISTIAIGRRDCHGDNGELLYLADNTNRRIVIVTTEKQQVASLTYPIPQNRQIKHLAVDSRGVIYIIDDSKPNSQVWRMNPDGLMLPPIIADPPITPACMALDPNDVLYVADRQSSQIFQFSRQGDQIGIFISPLVQFIVGLAIDNLFNLYILTNSSVTKLSPDGNVLGSYQQSASLLTVKDEESLYAANLRVTSRS